MKAYKVFVRGKQPLVVAFAQDERTARDLVWRDKLLDCVYIDLRARRFPDADKLYKYAPANVMTVAKTEELLWKTT